jgi:hypothetical protein
MLMKGIAELALDGPLRVLDCGDQLDAKEVAGRLDGNLEALDRICFARASSCPQVLERLEEMPACEVFFIVLDLLGPFYVASLPILERKRLLRSCIGNLDRLVKFAGGAVSVHPSQELNSENQALLQILQEAAPDEYQVMVFLPDQE